MNNQNWMLLSGAALGASAMYLMDPRTGARRRALLRDRVVRATHKTGGALDALGRDAANRARGLAAETRSRMRADSSNARKLQERVRAELGRVVSHPQAIDVYVSADGCVCLTGPVLMEEADSAISAIQSVKGVQEVDDRLERYATTEHVPSLQGDRTHARTPVSIDAELMVADDESAGLPRQHRARCRAWLRSGVRKRTDSRSGVGKRQLSHFRRLN